MVSLANKVALITGGSSGIGRAAAVAFARAGAKVVIAARGVERGRETAAAIEAEGLEARFVQADVAGAEQVAALVAETVRLFGRLDIAFNNAASLGEIALTADHTEEEFDASLGRNLKSVWLCMKFELRQMLAQSPQGGVILNTSSVNGLGGAPGGSFYSAAKAGVIALTKSAAREYAERGIRVNALVAGAFDTPMLQGVMRKMGGGTPEGTAAVAEAYSTAVPLHRIGRPEEAAAAAVWLCSDEASYVTGHSMIVDGGMTAGMR